MILPTQSLRAFKTASSFIKPNNLIPVLNYLRFGAGTLTKNNLNAFLVADMPGAEPMLVEELALWKAVDNATTETITITQEGATITIGQAKHQTITDAFPDNAVPSGAAIPIDHLLPDIAICAAVVAAEDMETQFSFVHVGNRCVGATDRIVAYYREQLDEVPEILLRREVAVVVAALKDVQYSENDSYQFFTTPGMLYGFSKPESKLLNLAEYFKLPANAPSLALGKASWMAFNNYVIGYTPAGLYWCDVTVDGVVNFGFNDTEWKKSYNVDADAEIVGDHAPWRGNAALINKLLKVLPDERITMYRLKEQYYITGESGFVALIQGAGIL